jgi:hypothetical protein
MNKPTTLWLCAAVLSVAACGGGNDAAPPPPAAATDAVPDAASQSVTGMTNWLSALTNDLTEVKEPLDVARFTPPAPDNSEPEVLQ